MGSGKIPRNHKRHRNPQKAEKKAENSNLHRHPPIRRRERSELYVSMRRIWVWPLVDIPHHHDRDDHMLFLYDEKARDELLDGLLYKT